MGQNGAIGGLGGVGPRQEGDRPANRTQSEGMTPMAACDRASVTTPGLEPQRLSPPMTEMTYILNMYM